MSEESFRATFEQAAVGIAHNALDGRWLRVNQRLSDMLGYTRQELLEKTFQEITHPDDLEADLEQVGRLRAGEIDTYSMEKRYVRKDGSIVWGNLTVSLVGEPSGDPGYFIAVVEDITERKRAEEELRRSEARLREAETRYRTLVEQIPAAIYIQQLGAPSTTTYMSPQMEAIQGYTSQDIMEDPQHWTKTLHPDDRERVLAEDARTNETGEPFKMEYRQFANDGRVVWVRDEAALVRDEEGNPLYWQGVLLDVTERKRTEEELKESEERFRAFFETAAVGAAQADPATGRFLQVNENLCRFLGYSKEELLSMTFPDVTHPDDRAHDLEGISRLLRGETQEYTTEKRYLRKDGQTVWGQVAVSLVRDAAGRALQAIAVTQDISARKAAEEALLEIREAERRRIARDLHDIVLQDLAGVLQGLQATQVESEDSTHAADLRPEIEALRTALGSLRNAIYDLRLEGRQPFVRAIESLVELNRQLTPEREITLTVQDGFPPELPDGMDVEVLRVLREALANIRRHSEARLVEVVLSNGRHRARVEVTDDGRGFDAASVRMGVGLSGMRERASEIGGELAVESGPGQGTRVKVEFPL